MNTLARSVLAACARAGVAEYVVCAGARNAAIAMPLAALSELDECPVRVWHFSEERAAGFFALGRSRALQQPVAVVTTSGTAVAELMPAAVEAFYQQVPLLLVTADRPKEFRGTGAPQAIEQAGMFGVYAGCAADVESVENVRNCLDCWNGCQPAHLNVCLPEPMGTDCLATAAEVGVLEPSLRQRESGVVFSSSDLESFLTAASNLVVLLGGGVEKWRSSLLSFLGRLGAPVLAEAVSGCREAAQLKHLIVRGGDQSIARLKVGSVLRIGDVPVWRLWRDLESEPDVPVFSVTSSGFSGLARPSTLVRGIDDWDAVQVVQCNRVIDNDAAMIDELLRKHPRSECGFVRWLSQTIPDGSLVFLGNSLPVREWNLAATMQDRGLRCLANRGTNGIDGNLSTAFGLAADEEECWVIVGDLTALYDMCAPWALGQMACRRVRIVVLNNRGGKIFSRLPSLNLVSDVQRQVMENGHDIEFAHWSAMWGMSYLHVKKPQILELDSVPYVIEIDPDVDSTRAFWTEWEQC